MSDTYCGKDCNECSYREKLNCDGCKSGPGRELSTECELASCCRNKRHATCNTCIDKSGCYCYLNRTKIPAERLKRKAEKSERNKELIPKAQLLKKWTDILFFVVIFSIIFSLITEFKVFVENEIFSTISYFGGIAFTIAYGVCLICMGKVCKNYYKSAVLIIGMQIGQAFFDFTSEATNLISVTTMLVLLIILTLLAEYFELMAHAEAVAPYNMMISGNWKKLWKWFIICYAVSMFAILMGTLIGQIFTLVLTITMLVLDIIKIMYIRQNYNAYLDYLRMCEYES